MYIISANHRIGRFYRYNRRTFVIVIVVSPIEIGNDSDVLTTSAKTPRLPKESKPHKSATKQTTNTVKRDSIAIFPTKQFRCFVWGCHKTAQGRLKHKNPEIFQ
jgi:hypothetical protein